MERPVIALVENDASFIAALERLLRATEFDTACYESAELFLQQLDLSRLACLVLDLHLPGMSGFELLSRLQQRAARLPVILMTADDSSATRERAIRSGCVGFLTKPFEASCLMEAIARSQTGLAVRPNFPLIKPANSPE